MLVLSSLPRPSSSFPSFPSSSFFRSCVWPCSAWRLRSEDSRQLFFFFPATGWQMPACVPLSRHHQSSDFRGPGLQFELLSDPSWKTRIHFYLFPILVLTYVPHSSFVTAPPTLVSRTTDSGGDGRAPEMRNEVLVVRNITRRPTRGVHASLI